MNNTKKLNENKRHELRDLVEQANNNYAEGDWEGFDALISNEKYNTIREEALDEIFGVQLDNISDGYALELTDLLCLIKHTNDKSFKNLILSTVLKKSIEHDKEEDFEYIMDKIDDEETDDKNEIYYAAIEASIQYDNYHAAKTLIKNLEMEFLKGSKAIDRNYLNLAIENESGEMIELIGPFMEKPFSAQDVSYCIEHYPEQLALSVLNQDKIMPNSAIEYINQAIIAEHDEVVEKLKTFINKENGKHFYYNLSSALNDDVLKIVAPLIDINETEDCFLRAFMNAYYYSNEDIESVLQYAKKNSVKVNTSIFIEFFDNLDNIDIFVDHDGVHNVLLKYLDVDEGEIIEHMKKTKIENGSYAMEIYNKLKIAMDKKDLNAKITTNIKNKNKKIYKM